MKLCHTIIFIFLFQAIAIAQPANDECINAILLTCGSLLTGETTVNSTDNGDALGCNPGIGTWYKIQPSANQTYEIVITNPTFNNEISIAEGNSCTNFVNLYCQTSGQFDRTHYFFGEANKEYYLFIGSFLNSSNSGTFDIQINCLPAPTNVICQTATSITCGDTLTSQSSTNSVDYGDPLGCETGIGVWYTFSPLVSESIEIIVENATFGIELVLAEGTACDNFVNLKCFRGSSIVFYGEVGKEYYLYVGDFNNGGQATGSFDLIINCLTPATNFSCALATVLSCGDTLLNESSIGAVDNNDILGSCSIGVATWYTFTPLADETIEISISNLDFTSEIAIVEGSACSAFNVLQCNRIFSTLANKVVFSGITGQQYYFVIGDESPVGTKTVTFDLSIDCLTPPSNDLCNNATTLTCGDILTNESSVGSTDQGNVSNCNLGVGVWYTFMSTNNDAYEINISNPSYELFYAVYSSVDCVSFTLLQCLAVSITSTPSYIFQANPGVNYYVYVGDRSDGTDSGTFDISIQCYEPATNATCNGAKNINCGDSLQGESIEGAVNTFSVSGCSIGLGVWYRFSTPDSMATRLTISNPSVFMEYGILSSSDCSNFTRIWCSTILQNGNEDFVFLAEPSMDYYIFVGNRNSSTTEYFDFDISLECVTPAPNLECITATTLECGIPFLNQTTTGGIDNGPISTSGGVGTWYQFTAQVTETMSIRIDNATEAYMLAVATSPDCNNFSTEKVKSSFNSTDSLVFEVDQGIDYYVFIGDRSQFGTTYLDFDILINCNTTLSNNTCIEATQLICGDNLIGESTQGATDNGDDLSCFTGVGVWYQYTPDSYGTAFLTVTPDPDYDISVAVANSNDCMTFTNILCSQTSGDGVTETFDFSFEVGESYYIYVGDRANNGTSFGTFDLNITCGFCPTENYAGPNSLTGIQNSSADFETNGQIESNQEISNIATVDYDSRTGIVLQADFKVMLGSVFHAFIDGCGGN